MAAKLQIKSLGALVKVGVSDGKGTPVMQPIGWNQSGKPLVRQATRLVSLHRGDTVPDDLADGELDRLRAQDAVGTPEEVAAVGVRSLEGQAAEPAAGEEPVPVDLSNLAAMSDEDLAGLYESGRPPTIGELVDAVGTDQALASRVLAAEQARTKGDPRAGLVEALEKLVGEEG